MASRGNAITIIRPYKWSGMWVFDDARVGLDKEPFVAGADTLIDTAIERKGIRNAARGFLLLFSATPFPGHDFRLNWQRHETGGDVYAWDETGQEGWLCPALLRYFDAAPKELYVQLREAEE